MRNPLPGLLLFLVAVGLLSAEEQKFTLAIPASEGTLSLGVFASDGRLVRKLVEIRPVEDFPAGLNGLILSWDGLDDSGKTLEGEFFVRGWFVPASVQVEGESYHFNTWLGPDGIPEMRWVRWIFPRKDAAFSVVGEGDEVHPDEIWEADSEGLLTSNTPFPPGAKFLGSGNPDLLLDVAGTPFAWNPGDPDSLRSLPGTAAGGAIAGNLAALLDGDARGIRIVNIGEAKEVQSLEIPADQAAVWGGGFLFWNTGKAWFWDRGIPKELFLGETFHLESLSEAPDETFWLAGSNPSGAFVRNYRFTGELLKELRLESPADRRRVFGSRNFPGFFLLTEHEGTQTVQGYHPPSADPADPRDSEPRPWEIFVAHSLEKNDSFGFPGDTRNASKTADTSLKVPLEPTELDDSPGFLTIHAQSTDDGVILASGDGLPLIKVTDSKPVQQLAVRPGEEPQVTRLLAGLPDYAEEFKILNLRNIVPLDAGKMETRK